MIGILGSGFGLYGYLPAIVIHTSQSIVLQKKSYSLFKSRPELQFCEERIIWVDNKEAILSVSDTIILSLLPQAQIFWARQCFSFPNIENIILEKPLATSPLFSKNLLQELISSNKSFRIAYSFIYTDWANELMISRLNKQSIKITWHFFAHHYKNNISNWKRYKSLGGGIIRFYGIHIIALLALWGYIRVVDSKCYGYSDDDSFNWIANFKNLTGHNCQVIIDAHSENNKFVIEAIDEQSKLKKQYTLVEMRDPFGTVSQNGLNILDSRVNILGKIINSVFDNKVDGVYHKLYFSLNKLWEDIECKTKIENIKVI